MTSTKTRFVMIAAVALLALPAFAQEDGDIRKEIQLTRQAIQNERQTMVTQTMDLTPEEADAFWPLYRDWRAKVAGLGDRQVKLITDFSEKYDSLADEDAAAIIDEWISIEDQHLKLTKQHLKRFRKVLPEKKVMRFMQIENKMDAVIEFELAGSIPLAK